MVETHLDLVDVARRFLMDPRTFKLFLATQPDFPAPILIRGKPHWLPDQVRDWEHAQALLARAAQIADAQNRANPGNSAQTAGAGDLPASQRRERK